MRFLFTVIIMCVLVAVTYGGYCYVTRPRLSVVPADRTSHLLQAADGGKIVALGDGRPPNFLFARIPDIQTPEDFPRRHVDPIDNEISLDGLDERVWWWLPSGKAPTALAQRELPAFRSRVCDTVTPKGRITLDLLFWAVDGGFVGCFDVVSDMTQLQDDIQTKVSGVARITDAAPALEKPLLSGVVVIRLIGNDYDEHYGARFHVPLGMVLRNLEGKTGKDWYNPERTERK